MEGERERGERGVVGAPARPLSSRVYSHVSPLEKNDSSDGYGSKNKKGLVNDTCMDVRLMCHGCILREGDARITLQSIDVFALHIYKIHPLKSAM